MFRLERSKRRLRRFSRPLVIKQCGLSLGIITIAEGGRIVTQCAVKFHCIERHTFASRLIAQGENLKYVQEQLGHASITITVDTYGHLIPGGNRQAVDRLDLAATGAETGTTECKTS